MSTDLVRHLEGVERRVQGEEPAVIGGDIQSGVALVDGIEQAAKVLPDGFRVVRIAMFEGVFERFCRQQATVLAEGAEENAVQKSLCAAENFLGWNRGVIAAEPGEHSLADIRVLRVELNGEFTPNRFGGSEEFVEMALSTGGNDALRAEQENEAFEEDRIGGEARGFEAFVRVLLGTFVVQARFAHGGDDDPVAGEIDGVTVGLVHGRHAAACEGAVERIATAFAFDHHDEIVRAFPEPAEYGVGDFTVDFDVAFAGEGESITWSRRACVIKEPTENVGEEIG